MNKNKQAVSVFNKLSDIYEQKYMDVSHYGHALNLFCQHIITQKAAIFELACGPGNVAKYLLERRPDFNYTGTDLSEKMIALAKKNNPSGNFYLFDSMALATLEEKQDGLIAAFLFPYLPKDSVLELIKTSASKLNPDGILYISTMEDDYSNSRLVQGSTGDEIFIYYHDSSYIIKALKSNGFSILLEERIPNGNDLDLIILAKKHS